MASTTIFVRLKYDTIATTRPDTVYLEMFNFMIITVTVCYREDLILKTFQLAKPGQLHIRTQLTFILSYLAKQGDNNNNGLHALELAIKMSGSEL